MIDPMPIRRIKQPGLARNTAVSTAGLMARWAAQAATFVLVARALGPSEYGAFVAVAAAAAILGPFASWGMPDRMVRAVSRDPIAFRSAWGTGLLTIALLGGSLAALLTWVSTTAYPTLVSVGLVLPIALAELTAAPVVALAASAFQAREDMARHSLVWLILVLARGAAAGAFFLLGSPEASVWAHWYLGATIAAGTCAYLVVTHRLEGPRFRLSLDASEAKDGFVFSVGLSSLAIANDVDKSMLARMATLTEAGIYGVGYKAVQVAFAPVVGLLDSSYARFFRAGSEGPAALRVLLRKTLPPAIAYSLLASAALWLLAPTLSWVLGPEFAESPQVIRWLAVVPLLKTIQLFAANALIGSGLHTYRTAIQIMAALANVILNLLWIPELGWMGAVQATLVYEALLGTLLWMRTVPLLRPRA